MNIDAAIKILKRDIHQDVPKSAYSARKHNEAVEMAINALLKQKPSRPIDRFTGDEWICECPVCRGITCTPDEVVIESIQYCAWCGQKIDWSEDDYDINTTKK